MAFEIDTGVTWQHRSGFGDARMDAILDGLPADAPQSQIDSAIYGYAIGYLREPKRLDTVRRHLLVLWPMILPLAEREPHLFDSILNEFSERASMLA